MLPVGSVPRSMWVVLEDDMVDSCKPGDDVIVTGRLFVLAHKKEEICCWFVLIYKFNNIAKS